MKFTDEEGKVWEWRGEYKRPHIGDYVLDFNGEVNQFQFNTGNVYALVHPVLPIHEFGGVRFRETGEVRPPRKGEWFWCGEMPTACGWDYEYAYPIVEVVECA